MEHWFRQSLVRSEDIVDHGLAVKEVNNFVIRNMVDGSGQVIGEGVSYGRYNDQNRLVAMTGFFETP